MSMLKIIVAVSLLLLLPVPGRDACAAEFPFGAKLLAPDQDTYETSGEGGRVAGSDHLPSLDEDDAYADQVGRIIADPLEPVNRAFFVINDVILEHAARPLSAGYTFVTPEFMRKGISNFFYNLNFPVRFTNNLLQGKPLAAGVEMSRFIFNTTAGLGGLFNPAEKLETVVPVSDEDTGQTMGVWGIGEGLYLVWPLLGPKTLRDTVGLGGDYLLSPTTWIDDPWQLGLGLSALEVVNNLDQILDMYDQLKLGAVDPYASVRDAYVQNRRAKIRQ
ncbi:MAG: VacJ family lipoprotein [Desulfovibrio sp.]|jgi:phospholipid-binding lipoprotein MlaA|nr:VacJ family lipoprotein [Desulfovibrio sp.]